MRVSFSLVFVGMLSAGWMACAQEQSAVPHLPEFAVTTIRPTSGNGPCGFMADGFECESISVKQLIKMAYAIDTDLRISGVPAWGESTKYRIVAKVDEADLPLFKDLPYDRRVLMLRQLLESRCNLEEHWVSNELPVYALTVAKGGSKLRPSVDDSAGQDGGHAKAEAGTVAVNVSGKTDGRGVPVGVLIKVISPFVDRIVVDDTNLKGNYDFSLPLPRLQANASGVVTSSVGGEPGSLGDPAASDPGQGSIYSAIADLGLRLQPRKASLQVLVVDRLSQPSSN